MKLKVKLSRIEKRMLRGDYGEACKKALELVLAIADAYGYGKLVKIKSAHISGISYKNIGDAGLEFIRDFFEKGARVRVKATMNPCGFDLDKPWLFNVDERFLHKQIEIIRLLEDMGVKPALTCTPYYMDNVPKKGEHIAWSESSAVVYVNSVIGAYTNRESGPSALASAITGRAALTRDHIEEERRPKIAVVSLFKPKDYCDWSLLGYAVGLKIKREIPLINISRTSTTRDKLKSFSAGFGTSSSASMFWLEQAKTDAADIIEKIEISHHEISELKEKWHLTRKPTVVFIGCPHCSLRELREIALRLNGKKVRGDVKLIISTSRSVLKRALKLGLCDVIEKSGAHLVKDTCLVVSPIKLSKSDVLLTDSAKTAYYIESMSNALVAIENRNQCLKEALRE